MSSIKERILQISDNKESNRENFFKKFSFSYSNFRGKSKISAPSADIIVEISSEYPDICLEWLLTGKGSMIKSKEPSSVNTNFKELAESRLEIIQLQKEKIRNLEEKLANIQFIDNDSKREVG